jgi:hypothetical protein
VSSRNRGFKIFKLSTTMGNEGYGFMGSRENAVLGQLDQIK